MKALDKSPWNVRVNYLQDEELLVIDDWIVVESSESVQDTIFGPEKVQSWDILFSDSEDEEPGVYKRGIQKDMELIEEVLKVIAYGHIHWIIEDLEQEMADGGEYPGGGDDQQRGTPEAFYL